jgi:phosphorylcholine metabolism protein LicD
MRKESRLKMINAMLKAKEVLDRNDIFFWLDGGTLLWAYRDGEADPTDTDFSIHSEDSPKLLSALQDFYDNGFALHKIFRNDILGNVQLALGYQGYTVDVFFKYNRGKNSVHYATDVLSSIPYVQPTKHFKKFDKINLGGVEWNIPCEVEDYLEIYYGNTWREHISQWDWKTSSPCIKRDWRIE